MTAEYKSNTTEQPSNKPNRVRIMREKSNLNNIEIRENIIL